MGVAVVAAGGAVAGEAEEEGEGEAGSQLLEVGGLCLVAADRPHHKEGGRRYVQ